MKCPKCRYIGFDQGDRCRNCGYDFSLSVDVADLDLPIKTGNEALGPFADFNLAELDIDRDPPEVPSFHSNDRAAEGGRPSELPLFHGRAIDDDAPLVSLPASPRAPVAVRKSTAARSSNQRSTFDEPVLDLEPAAAAPPPRGTPAAAHRDSSLELATAHGSESASVLARLGGAVIDLLLIGAIDAAVVYFTLRLCGFSFSEIRQLPLVPLAAFLALLNGGYVAAFTAAGGQSIGKMAAGTRVVTDDESGATFGVPLGQAVVRAAAYAVSLLPAGAGFLPALFGADRRALHDRLAQTRVVKA